MVESDLAPARATDPNDVTRIVNITMIAWCMERMIHLSDRPIPVLMTAFAPDGLVLGNIHPELLRDAMRRQRRTILKRMETLPEPTRSATHVLIHLSGSILRPWSLSDRICAFGNASSDPAIDWVFVALEDTSEESGPETARTLLRLMLASGTDN